MTVDATVTDLFQVRSALYTLALPLYATYSTSVSRPIRVAFGNPGLDLSENDWVVFSDMGLEQQPATLSASNRSREETGTVTVQFGSFVSGEASDDLEPTRRATGLLGVLDKYTRQSEANGGNTTLGGVCRWINLTHADSDGITPDAYLGQGRQIEIKATFTYAARITN